MQNGLLQRPALALLLLLYGLPLLSAGLTPARKAVLSGLRKANWSRFEQQAKLTQLITLYRLARPRARWYQLRGLPLVGSQCVSPQCSSSLVITRGSATPSAMDLPVHLSKRPQQTPTSTVKLPDKTMSNHSMHGKMHYDTTTAVQIEDFVEAHTFSAVRDTPIARITGCVSSFKGIGRRRRLEPACTTGQRSDANLSTQTTNPVFSLGQNSDNIYTNGPDRDLSVV